MAKYKLKTRMQKTISVSVMYKAVHFTEVRRATP